MTEALVGFSILWFSFAVGGIVATIKHPDGFPLRDWLDGLRIEPSQRMPAMLALSALWPLVVLCVLCYGAWVIIEALFW